MIHNYDSSLAHVFHLPRAIYHRCQVRFPKCIWHIHAFVSGLVKIKPEKLVNLYGGQIKHRTLFLSPYTWMALTATRDFSNFLDRYCGNHNAGIEATCLSHRPTILQRKGLFLLLNLGWTEILLLFFLIGGGLILKSNRDKKGKYYNELVLV